MQLAAGGLGRTRPNPVVGAVIVKDGKVVGEGLHLKAGESHAEVVALREAEAEAQGATLYLTCLLYTSPSPRDQRGSRMPSSA